MSSAALRLWNEKGFECVSWADISEATGVSTRTLLRHFSTKETLAWTGIVPATDALRNALALVDTGDLALDLRTAIVGSTAVSDDSSPDIAHWLRIISGAPSLIATSVEAHGPWIGALEDFLADRMPGSPRPVLHGIAVAYQVATFDALLDWAESGEEGLPSEAVDRALEKMPLIGF
ncbi:TetR/AcrR family transcriptional regulator [Brachybacterium sp. DNPG3]